MRIRRATPNDLEAIVRVDLESGLTPWESNDYATFVERPDWDVLVADHRCGEVVGLLVNRRVGGEAELLKITVAGAWRGQGVGRALLVAGLRAAVQAGCSHCFLEVRPSNLAALALYRRHGFVECGRRPNYYHHPPEAALLMSKELSCKRER